MTALDKTLIDVVDFQKSIQRIKSDVRTDFIFAPHINSIYNYAGDVLSNRLKTELQNGIYNYDLPILMGIPKPSGLTRPGAILLPKDRLLYQILSDNMIGIIENELDRSHVFSNLPDNNGEMFISSGESYRIFENAIIEKCFRYQFCFKTDISSYFDTIYQHFLISQLHSTNIEKGFINLLERSLLQWREDKSYGILQGMYPSDLFGNYYLSQIDYYLNLENIDFVRYVDDIYIFSNSYFELKKIAVKIGNTLRQQGLFLNENKTLFTESIEIRKQILEFNELFNEINNMFNAMHDEERFALAQLGYGFQINWDDDTNDNDDINRIEGFNLEVVEELYINKDDAQYQKDSIIKFCLPLLSKAKSTIPLSNIKNDMKKSPHLMRFFSAYLASIEQADENITNIIENILFEDQFVFEYQQMWLFAALLYRNTLSKKILSLCVNYFRDKQNHESIRALCAIILSKKGSGHDRKLLRDEYNSEASIFVKSAILYCTRYLISDERHACKLAWGSHNYLNELIVEVLKKI
jgi:hypothetical protein